MEAVFTESQLLHVLGKFSLLASLPCDARRELLKLSNLNHTLQRTSLTQKLQVQCQALNS